ncbi:MAG: MBL fold metallo-hydrolase [Defluviitaleaceae bacterium]|nr:MBL fold metallo-hydrolase [Defluviitaleaceae bacterium]
MKVKTFNANDMRQNTYLYYDEESGEGVFIDAGCSSSDIVSADLFIKESVLTIKGVLLTHGHYDHIIGAEGIRGIVSAPIYSHEAELSMLSTPSINLSTRIGGNLVVLAEKTLKNGDVFSLKNTQLKVLHVPGHTSGGVCYYDEINGILFSGDILFKESIGRSDLPGGNHQELVKNIVEKLFILPDDTIVYPGHGASTTIGHEKSCNPFLG